MFYYRDRAKQLIDFDSLSSGKMHPTDIDGIIEYKDRKYVVLEYKFNGKEVDVGQRLCLERMVKDFIKAGKDAVALVCDHYIEDTDLDVQAGQAIVREAYHGSKWNEATCIITVAEYVERFLGEYEISQS